MLHHIVLSLGLLAPSSHAQLPIVHEAFCAGLLNSRAGKVLDSMGSSNYVKRAHHEAEYLINGRMRRVTIGTQEAFARVTRAYDEPLPEHRMEVPMVNERLPLYTRQIRPALRNLMESNLARRARVLFNDPKAPEIRVTRVPGTPEYGHQNTYQAKAPWWGGPLRVRAKKLPKVVLSRGPELTRFTYPVVNGARVGIPELKRLAETMFIKGFGRTRLLAPNAPRVEVVIGGRVFAGAEFYSYLAAEGEADASTRWEGFARFVNGLSVRHLLRNMMTPAEQKVGYRPRYVFPANEHGELTPKVMNDVSVELDERTDGADPRTYDVVVGGRAFSGDDFEEARKRMITEGVISIDAERGFESTAGGVAAVAVSQMYTLFTRLYGAVTLAALTMPGLSETTHLKAAAVLATVAAVSVTGSVIDNALDNSEFPHSDSRLKRTFRTLAYLIPNYSALFDSSNYHAVEVRRARALVENVQAAVDRHDVNDVVIITNGTRDIRRIKQAFNAKYDRMLDSDLWPVLGASSILVSTDPQVRKIVAGINDTFSRRDFGSGDEFVEYFDPRRWESFASDLRHPESAAQFAYYFFKNLRESYPVFLRCGPSPANQERLNEVERLFAPYDLIPVDANHRFLYKALRLGQTTSE